MKITIKGNKLFLENGILIYLTKEMINKFNLKNNSILTEEELNSIIFFRIKLSTINLLAKRDYFKNEIKKKLFEKHPFPEIIDEVVEYFSEKGYFDDRNYALTYARAHINYGPKKLSYIFSRMGLDRDDIRDILEEIDDNQFENIKKLWDKLGDKDQNKKINSLMRKGFLYRDIKEFISLLEEE